MKKKLLIIEDNEQNMYLMAYLLTSHGYEVTKAFNGMDGIHIALDMIPDMILLDIQLPSMNGYDVAFELRKHHSLQEVPIVAVTSYAMPGDKERIISAGATAYIEKPINPDTFVTQVQDFFH